MKLRSPGEQLAISWNLVALTRVGHQPDAAPPPGVSWCRQSLPLPGPGEASATTCTAGAGAALAGFAGPNTVPIIARSSAAITEPIVAVHREICAMGSIVRSLVAATMPCALPPNAARVQIRLFDSNTILTAASIVWR